jgi:hypothetical protein
MSKLKFVELRVRSKPYIVYLILGGWCPFVLIDWYIEDPKSRDDLLQAMILFLFVFGFLFLSFWLYRVQLRENILIERGLLKVTKRLPVLSIQQWRCETGWPDQRWYWRFNLRPFRRIAIYYTEQNRKKHFDISINHFDIEKVRVMIEAVLAQRPDLDWPKGFTRHATKKR